MRARIFILMLTAGFVFSACDRSNDEEPYSYYGTQYVPVLMKYDELVNSVKPMPPRLLKNPGKIYLYGTYMLIVEKYKGFHLIDNSNPAAPQNISFVSVPGCVDVAVKDNIVFADNAVDLVTISIADKSQIFQTGRVAGVFPEMLPPDSRFIPYLFTKENRPARTVIVEWRVKDETI